MSLKRILRFTLLLGLVLEAHDALAESVNAPEDPAVTRLRSYLRIQSAHPTPEAGYEEITQWMRQQAEEIGLDFHFLRFEEPAQFTLWMTWNGTNPTLKSVLFNSHQDVVIADREKWTYDPFKAHKDNEGTIYGRGAIDMKSVTVAELEAIRRLKKSGYQPLRNIHLSIMPDEEKGGNRGMLEFVRTDAFKKLNVGIDIDEGRVTDLENVVNIYYTEKTLWQFNITARGTAAHTSTFPQYTASHRLQIVINKLFEFRQSEYDKLESQNATLDELTTINLARIGGGTADNIIPSQLWASFDMRIWLRPGWNFTDIENMLNNIVKQAALPGPNNAVSISYIQRSFDAEKTIANDSNVWWTTIQNTCRELNFSCPSRVFTGATDGRLVRSKGIPVFGISPFTNTPPTAHQDNERINEREFLRGIDRYMALIKNIASVPQKTHA